MRKAMDRLITETAKAIGVMYVVRKLTSALTAFGTAWSSACISAKRTIKSLGAKHWITLGVIVACASLVAFVESRRDKDYCKRMKERLYYKRQEALAYHVHKCQGTDECLNSGFELAVTLIRKDNQSLRQAGCEEGSK